MDIRRITYEIVEETYMCAHTVRVSYGIVAYVHTGQEEADEPLTIVASVRDLSSDKDRVLDLILKWNDMELSPIHMDDAIQDFLT